MFIGHYGIAFALKPLEKKVSLGLLFVAVQFVDVLWTIFVLTGIERVALQPGITAASPWNFLYYPYTHSLLMSGVWAIVIYLLYRFAPTKVVANRTRAALILAVAVVSHFLLDLIVHRPDLPLAFGDSPKFGFGLWNHVAVVYTLESAIFVGGLYFYLRSTKGSGFKGKYGMIVLAALLLFMNSINLFGPPPDNIAAGAIAGLIMFLALGIAAHWLDRARVS